MNTTGGAPALLFLLAAGACGGRAPAVEANPHEAPAIPPPAIADAATVTDAAAADAVTSDAAVHSRLTPADVQRVLRASMPAFRACFEEGLRASPSLSSRVVVRFVISADGTVTKSHDAGSDLPDARVVSCVVAKVGKLRFPSTEGPPLTVTYPFAMTPGD